MASSSRQSCFQCEDASSAEFRNGWRLRSGEFAQLCQRCARLIKGGDETDIESLASHTFLDKVVVNFNMLSASVKHRVDKEVERVNVVTHSLGGMGGVR
ncbi:hypothetical protein RJ640_004542 [Escallonia rubra]|uniref:Uncharacterized protein n=1 Tax=Escallonia rubra TaxID=112253 RepID=A0AA88RCJ9_9ASTE|nr:hypothetical protein RJ640_004542 [Escallonia rubra]